MMRLRVLATLAFVASGCGDGGGPGGTPQVLVSPLLDSLFVGDTLPPGALTVTYLDAAGHTQPTGPVTWRSDRTVVATVNAATGQVAGVGPGETIIFATANGVTGGALLVVSRGLQVTLLLDTIYVMPGDTITIPVTVLRRGGGAPAPWFSPSPNLAVYAVDSATGLLRAWNPGTARFIVRADTVADTGAVDVRVLTDTTGGRAYYSLLGTVIQRGGAEARGVNYRRQGDTLTFRLNAGRPSVANPIENVVITLRDPVIAPGVFAIDSLSPAEAYGAGADPVCRPIRPWALWAARQTDPPLTALSRHGGFVAVTRIDTVIGGLAISGRFRFDAQRTDFYANPLGVVPVRGTFVAPLVADTRPCRSG